MTFGVVLSGPGVELDPGARGSLPTQDVLRFYESKDYGTVFN